MPMKWVSLMSKEREFDCFEDELESLANRAFSIIEIIEVANISEPLFILARRKLLNLGNDVLRLKDKYEVGDKDVK